MYGYGEWLELQRIASEEFGRRVHRVTDWTAATPDARGTCARSCAM